MLVRLAMAACIMLLAAVGISQIAAVAQIAASAQIISGPMVPGGGGPMVPTGGGATPTPPPSCTADGKTDWSNACDIPLGVALGVM